MKMSFRTLQLVKTSFQALETRRLKRRKIAIFLKGLTHGFGPKMSIFSTSFFQAKQARKMCFTIFQNEKTPFQAIKTRRSKSRKIVIFLKGLSHCFWTKMAFLATSFYQAKQARKMSFTITQNQKTPFYALKKKSSKSRKIAIFPKGLTHGFCPKMAIFPTFFFLGKRDQEKSFYDILERKNTFLGYKNKKFKKSKNSHFSKGVNPWFLNKNVLFWNFFFYFKTGQENVFDHILD